MTDVAMAVDMISSAYQDRMDLVVLISNDIDMVPAIKEILLHFPRKEILILDSRKLSLRRKSGLMTHLLDIPELKQHTNRLHNKLLISSYLEQSLLP